MMRSLRGGLRAWAVVFFGLIVALGAAPSRTHAQSDSVSAWEAADFRTWTFVPYWTSQSQVNSFATDRVYDHVSDVLYFSGVQPNSDGSLHTLSGATGHLAALKNHQAQFGFRYHMSMRDPNGGGEEEVWNALTSSSTARSAFVTNVANLLSANNMTGFNLDWERPNSMTQWANYTQLAKDLQAGLPASTEVSVDDYGFADGRWDDSAVFDAAAYDQLFIMGYHYPAFGNGSLNNNNFANGKLALGASTGEAFTDEQLVMGIGTWGAPVSGGGDRTLKSIVAANPNLPYDAGTYSQGGNTWTIESRAQVREKVQLALDRNMAGAMFWSMLHDATNKLSLHRVAHHYIVVKRGAPDLDLDGQIDAADATTLADNMGIVTGATGMATPAQFEAFYQGDNWEKGDRDGNGFVNQADADWLSGRFAALSVALPDRLAYTGTFEKLNGSVGINGRWRAAPLGPGGALPETGNFTQHDAGFLSWTGTGAGAAKHSNAATTLRNQNGAEAAAAVNAAPRSMQAELGTPIDLGQHGETYVTFLVRQNTAPLSASQAASPNRTLALEFLDAAGASQFDFVLHGQQQQFGIRSQADAAGDDAAAGGFGPDATWLFVGKIAGNDAGANTIEASLFAGGAAVGNFTDPSFAWELSATGSDGFNPVITDLQLTSLHEANFTVSNVWIGSAGDFFSPPAPGDFNADGQVDDADLPAWMGGFGAAAGATHWSGDADGDGDADGADFLLWQQQRASASEAAAGIVPEPAAATLVLLGLVLAGAARPAVWGRAVGRRAR